MSRKMISLLLGLVLSGMAGMLGCSESGAMNMSAAGYRQMGTPAGSAMSLLMQAGAEEARRRESQQHSSNCPYCRTQNAWQGRISLVQCRQCGQSFPITYAN